MTTLRAGSILVLMLAAGALAAPAPRPKPNKVPDLNALAGTWRVVRYHQNNRSLSDNREIFMKVDKDQITFQVGERGNVGSAYGVTVDPKRTPAVMNWRSGNGNRVSYTAIYKYEGDTLSVAFTEARADPDHDRPTGFKTLRPRDYLMELKRMPAKR